MADELFTCVTVGVTGDGKSTTCNTLCGQDHFDTSGGLSSETSRSSHLDYLHIGLGVVGAVEPREIRIVDTIGLHDTGLPSEEVLQRFAAFSDLVPCGINMFLFVVRWGRFKPEHEAAFDAFCANCGEAALGNTLLAFSSCSLSPEALATELGKHAPESLRRLLPKLVGPPVGFDSVRDRSGARAILHSAIDAAAIATEGRRYSNAALAEARVRFDAAQEQERAAFAAAVSDWRKGSGPVIVEREL